MFPNKASHLQVIEDNFLESVQPINMQGLWVCNPIPGLLGETEIDRIDPCPKGSHFCRRRRAVGSVGAWWFIPSASVSSIVFGTVQALNE